MAARKRKNAYSPKNPKIDIYWLDGGGYIGSTRWSNTLKEAKAKAEKKYGKGKVGVEFDRDFNDRHFLKGGTPRKGKKMATRKRNPGHTKWEKLYILQGNYGYGHGWEDLAAESQDQGSLKAHKAIRQTRKEYRENEGGNYRIIERRELRSKDNPVDWRGAGRKAWGGAKGAAAKAAHAAKVAKARTKVKSAESKIKALKSCAVDLDVFPSELASTKAMKAAQRSLTTAKDDVKKIQAAKPKGQEEDVSWYLYAKKNAPTRRTNARKPRLKKGDQVTMTGRRWFDSFGNTYHTVWVAVLPKGGKRWLEVGESPITYGYGDHFLQTGRKILEEKYYMPQGWKKRKRRALWELRDFGVKLHENVYDVKRKRDL